MGVYEPGEDPFYERILDYDDEDGWHIGQSWRPVLVYEEVIRDLAANYPSAQSELAIERHVVLHEVLHRFYGPHGQGSLTEVGNMSPPTTVVGDDLANMLTRQQLRYVQDKDSPTPHPNL